MTSARTIARIVALGAACLLAGCVIAFDETSPPPPRGIILNRVQRGPFYTVATHNGYDYTETALTPNSATFQPADAVVFDSASKKFQFVKLGDVTVTVSTEQLTSTITVVEAQTIVFDMVVNGNRDIYSQTIFGFNFTRLTTDPADDVDPTASKGKLVFTSYRDGNAELYSKPLDGSAPETRLTSTPANETDAELSPDGTHLAYVRDDGGVSRIWIADAQNANATLLTNAAGATNEGHPRWYETSDYLLMTSTALGGTSIFRASATPPSAPTSFVIPKTADSTYDDPEVFAMRSSNFAVGGAYWIASKSGGPRQVHMASVIFNGSGADRNGEYIVTPLSVSLGEPSPLQSDGAAVFTLYGANGSTSLGWILMSAPIRAFDVIWNPIAVPGVNPRRAAEVRP